MLCFVGWNAQTATGAPVLKWEMFKTYWCLLDGDVKSNGGFPLSKCRWLKSICFCCDVDVNGNVFVTFNVRMLETCWYLLDGVCM